jgi:hypothetical protein
VRVREEPAMRPQGGGGGGAGESGAVNSSGGAGGTGAGGHHATGADGSPLGANHPPYQHPGHVPPGSGPMDPNYHQWYAAVHDVEAELLSCFHVLLARSADASVGHRAAEQQSMHVYGTGAHDRKYPGGMPPGMPPGSGPYPGYTLISFAFPTRLLLFAVFAPFLRLQINGISLAHFVFILIFAGCTGTCILVELRVTLLSWATTCMQPTR